MGNQHRIFTAWFKVEQLRNRNRGLSGRRSWHITAWLARNLIPVHINIRGFGRRVNAGPTIVVNLDANVHVDENLGEFTETLGSVGRNILLRNAISRAVGVVVVDGNGTGLPQISRESKVNGITVLIKYLDRIGRRQRSLGSTRAHNVRSLLAFAWFTRQLKGVNNNSGRH